MITFFLVYVSDVQGLIYYSIVASHISGQILCIVKVSIYLTFAGQWWNCSSTACRRSILFRVWFLW